VDGEESAMKKGMKSMFVTTAGGNGRSAPGQQVNSTISMIHQALIFINHYTRALYDKPIVIYVRDEKPPLGEISYSRLFFLCFIGDWAFVI